MFSFHFFQLEKQAQSCRVCKGSLGVRKKKRNCKVCGLALCKRCSNQDLLLYMDDAENRDKLPQPKIGIINFTGVSPFDVKLCFIIGSE